MAAGGGVCRFWASNMRMRLAVVVGGGVADGVGAPASACRAGRAGCLPPEREGCRHVSASDLGWLPGLGGEEEEEEAWTPGSEVRASLAFPP